MATRKPDPVKYSSPDGGQTKYIENQRVADDLKNLKKPVNAVAGKPSGDRSKRMAKNRQYVERKRGSTPTKRTVAGGPNQSSQPVSRPPAPPPAQSFAQNGMQRGAPPQPQYNPLPNYNMQRQGPPPQPQYNPLPQQPMMQPRPSAFGQPNSAMTMGIQPMGNPYMNSQNPAQMMSGYQPPMGNPNPWGRRW